MVELAAKGRPGEALGKLQDQARVHEIPDVSKRYQAIAANFLIGHQAGQSTLVVSPGNDERRELNHHSRDLNRPRLRGNPRPGAFDPCGQGYEQGPDGLCPQLRGRRRDPFQRRDKRQTFPVAAISPSIAVNRAPTHSFCVAMMAAASKLPLLAGKALEYTNGRIARSRWVIESSLGLLITAKYRQWRVRHDCSKSIAAKLRFNTIGPRWNCRCEQLRHVDHGYASTSHSAQGATVDRVIVNADSMRSVKLVNRDQFYVSISRARHDAQVFTNDLQTLEPAVGRNPQKGWRWK